MDVELPAGSSERHFRTDHLMSDLAERVLSGGLITAISQAARFGLYFASNIILARMLAPKDFGLVAMVVPLTVFMGLLRWTGLSAATVQKESMTHAQASNVFWINLGIALLCTCAGIALAPLMSWFYRDERLTGVTVWLSLTFLMGGATFQHLALLNRQMRFKDLALVDIVSMLMSLIIGVIMAHFGFRYWSLVGAQLASSATELCLAWWFSPWRPQLPKRGSGTRSIVHFGASLTFATLLRRIASASDNLLVGRYFGANALGLYSRGMALVMRPLDQFLGPFDMVFVPMLCRLQNQPERYRKSFLQIYNAIALVSLPAAGLLLGLSSPLVLMLLGSRWREVVPIFACLSIAALYYPLAAASMWLLTTQGRSRDIMISGAAISIILICSFVAGLPFGPTGVALSFSLCGLLIRLPVQYYIAGRAGVVRAADLWRIFLRHLPCWGIVSTFAYLPQLLLPRHHPLNHAVIGAVCGMISAAAFLQSIPSYRRDVLECMQMAKRLFRPV